MGYSRAESSSAVSVSRRSKNNNNNYNQKKNTHTLSMADIMDVANGPQKDVLTFLS